MVRIVRVSSEVKVEPRFLEERKDLGSLLAKSEFITGMVVKIGAVIPFAVAKKDPPKESDVDMKKAARYAGNSLVAHVMASVLAQRFPPVNVRIPATRYDREKNVEHPSAAFSVYDYVPHVFPIKAGDIPESQYAALMKEYLDKALQFALNNISCRECDYPDQFYNQFPAHGYVKGKVFQCQKPGEISPDMFFMHNFGERLDACREFGNDLHEKLKEAHGENGLSAVEIKGIVERSVAIYRPK